MRLPFNWQNIDRESSLESWFFPPSAVPAELQLQISLKRKKDKTSWLYFISAVIPTKSVTGVNDQFVKALTALSWEWPILEEWLHNC